MASLGSYHESYQKVSVVRGHHIYKVVWTPEVGEVLQVRSGVYLEISATTLYAR